MSFIEYLNRQLNPTGDADMQAAMNWGLAPGFPRVSSSPSQALNAFKPTQQRQAASKGKTSMPAKRKQPPSRGIPTLPNRPKRPAMPTQIAQQPPLRPIGPAQMDNRQFMPGEEMPQGPAQPLPDAAYFAPPTVPMYDNGMGQGVAQLPDFGGGGLPMEPAEMPQPEMQNMPEWGGLPMEYADMPMPQMADAPVSQQQPHSAAGMVPPAQAMEIFKRFGEPNIGNVDAIAAAFKQAASHAASGAGQPVAGTPARPVLQLGIGRNASPYGNIDYGAHVKNIGQGMKGYTKGKASEDIGAILSKGKQLGFIGPGGRKLDATATGATNPDYASLPAINAPMEYAEMPSVAVGLEGEADRDFNPMQDARHALEDDGATMDLQAKYMYDEYRKQQKAAAFGAMFGNRQMPTRMSANMAMYGQYLNNLQARRQAAQANFLKAAGMYDPNTMASKAAMGNLEVNRGRLKNSEEMTRIQRGQLDRQTAKDEYTKQHDSEVLKQRQDEGIGRQAMSAQDAMVRAMLGQQQSKDRGLDRQSREGIARANREAAGSRASAHDKTMVDLFGKKTQATADSAFRKQVLSFQDKLAKNDKRLDVHSMMDAMSGRIDKGTAAEIAKQQASLPSWKAMTEEGRMRMLAAAFANHLAEEMPGEVEGDGDSDD